MYQRIVVAVDGSSVSDRALQAAVDLAREQGGRLRIVHAVDEVTVNLDGEFTDLDEIQERFCESGVKILERAKAIAQSAGIEVETRLIEIQTMGHRIADVISEDAQSWGADLIVIGTHGRRGVHRVLLGSVAEGVSRTASVPVLLIRGT